MSCFRKSRKGLFCVLLITCMLICMIANASAASAKDAVRPVGAAAENFYLWGLNTNDPDFGAMSAPTGSFVYDGDKGYYYYDLLGASGDYCFVVSKVRNSGATAVRTPAIGGVAERGRYSLQQGNYRGYACMHLWNPACEDIRIYFTPSGAGLYAVPLSSVGDNPTERPTDPTSSSSENPTETIDGYLYCLNEAGWENVCIYLWNSDDDKNAKWPGIGMTYLGENVWRYHLERSYAKVIFNIGSEETQTSDLNNPGPGKIYNNLTGVWSDYDDAAPSTATTPSVVPTSVVPTGVVTPTSPAGTQVIYCENEAGWGRVYAYLWNNDDDKIAKWPGVEMTNVGNNIWRCDVPKDYAKIIFNIGSSETQTLDMSFPGYGYLYNNKTQKWSIYDTSPLQVLSFSTDLTSPQFAGVSVTLSASASGQGIVRYRFSVTDSSGNTEVIADYSAQDHAVWTPAEPGVYILVYEFRDTAGNTNKRTSAFKVGDGSDSESPFIKQVTPAFGEQIRKSSPCQVTVSAGGGNVGTRLLFYKYTVTDASGKIVNVPYYTRSSSYSFTPAELGDYTLTVSVQGSDNATDQRSYVYHSVDTIVDPTEPTEPVLPSDPTDSGDASEPTADPTDPSAVTLIGDADRNGKVTVIDATHVQRYLAKLVTKDEIDLINADADRNGRITVMDATQIQRFLAKLITAL